MAKLYTNRAWLKYQYYNKNKTLAEMARLARTSEETIRRWMHKYGLMK